MSKKRKIIGGAMLAIALVVLFCGVLGYRTAFSPNVKKTEQAQFIFVYPTDGYTDVMRKIERTNAIEDFAALKRMAEIYGYEQKIKVGRYEIVAGETNLQLLQRLAKGRQTPVRITFNNIRTKQVLAEKICEKLMMTPEELLATLNAPETLAQYGLNANTIVSIFLPNTYEVYWNITPADFIAKMKKEYDKFWNKERLAHLDDCQLTQTEVSTLASIVEEETNKRDEQPIVAGLYLNRLRIGMPLQADPTVRFALQDFTIKRIRGGHLQCDSPYNTYLYAGLPPGPIRIPSASAIDAVLNHTHHNYLYMCAKEDFSGYHNFAATYAEHQANAEKYRRTLNRRGIK